MTTIHRISIGQLNRMTQAGFVEALGAVFEHSPWVAERAYAARPFADSEQLHRAMLRVVDGASREERLALLRAHPDLAGRLQMSELSVQEQRGVGLNELSVDEYDMFTRINTAYTGKFGFPFIMAVKGSSKELILEAMLARLEHNVQQEQRQAMTEIAQITRFRLDDLILQEGNDCVMTTGYGKRTMYYGKGDVLVYRTYVKPLEVSPIPESAYTGSDNVIFALNVTVSVSGDAFLPSFTQADNSMVVATDSMKNFMLRHAADFEGSTVEAFLRHAACLLLHKYAHMSGVELSAERLPFDAVPIAAGNGEFRGSGLVYRRSRNESGRFTVRVERTGQSLETVKQSAEITNLHLIKVSGSSFANFVRDEYTTLPESFNRPLFIYLNIGWEYAKADDALDGQAYAAPEQIADIAHTVFHEVNSASIQSLIYVIGLRILERFPQLGRIWFESNNRTWETVAESAAGSSEAKVFTEPRPPFGFQGFSMTQEDLAEAQAAQKAQGAALT
ncbi:MULTISPECIES: factor-independent urate hydroxylase [Paenibacillus]